MRTRWAQELYEMTSLPRKIEIVPGTDAHGVAILKVSPLTVTHILEWLEAALWSPPAKF